jgi:hypothetical protein
MCAPYGLCHERRRFAAQVRTASLRLKSSICLQQSMRVCHLVFAVMRRCRMCAPSFALPGISRSLSRALKLVDSSVPLLSARIRGELHACNHVRCVLQTCYSTQDPCVGVDANFVHSVRLNFELCRSVRGRHLGTSSRAYSIRQMMRRADH